MSKDTAKFQSHGKGGKFVKETDESVTPVPPLFSKSAPPSDSAPALVSVQVTNPITYLKLWWKRILGNEGVDFRFRIRPLTTITILLVILGASFSVGWVTAVLSQVPVIREIIPTPTPTPDPWRETAYTGLLRQSGERFYLVTNEAEAITLEVPENVNLTKYIGKRILAVGRLNKNTGIMHVTDASDLEVLIQSAPIATFAPSSTPQN